MASISNQGKALYAWSGSEWIPLNGGTNFSTIQRWNKIFDGGQTTISGNDENDNLLIYTPGYEQVYLNGILLVRNEDYTATNGVEINLSSPLNENDVLDIIIFIPLNIGNTYTRQQSDAKYASVIDLEDQINDILDGAPEALDTLNELSAALNDDPNFYSTIAEVYLTQTSASATYATIEYVNNLDDLPSQEGNDGKYLKTDGTNAIWFDASDSFAPKYLTATSVSANYQLQLSDVAKVIEVNSSSTVVITIPTNNTVAFPIGTVINVYRQGTGTVTIGGAGVTIRNVGSISDQFAEVSLRKRDTNEWVLVGSIV